MSVLLRTKMGDARQRQLPKLSGVARKEASLASRTGKLGNLTMANGSDLQSRNISLLLESPCAVRKPELLCA